MCFFCVLCVPSSLSFGLLKSGKRAWQLRAQCSVSVEVAQQLEKKERLGAAGFR